MSKKMYALVKWIGGSDDKKYTAGIDVDWIKDFDYYDYKNDFEDPDKIYVVEWRDSRREPLGGWTCFNAMIIAVSASIKVLDKKINALDGMKSPTKIIPDNDCDDGEDNFERNTERTTTKRRADQYENVDSEASASKKLVYSETQLHHHQTPDFEILEDDLKTNTPVRHDVNKSTPSTSNGVELPETSANNYVTKEYLKEALSEIVNLFNKKSSELKNPPQIGDINADPELKELGSKGSGIFVTTNQWNAIKSKSTFTSMGIALVMAKFDTKTLLRSNYKGGKSKIKKNDEVHFSALDKNIISAIKETVKYRFKNTYDEAKFGIAINNKLTSIRRENRKKNNSTEDKVDEDIVEDGSK